MKSEVEAFKQKFVKKNTQFKVMSDDFTEHADYDDIHQKLRKIDRK